MSSQHPIDDLFKRELENREPEFREEYWQEAEELLNRSPKTMLQRNQWFWFGSMAVVVLIGSGIGFYFGTLQHSSNKQNTIVESSKQVGETQASDHIAADNGTLNDSLKAVSRPSDSVKAHEFSPVAPDETGTTSGETHERGTSIVAFNQKETLSSNPKSQSSQSASNVTGPLPSQPAAMRPNKSGGEGRSDIPNEGHELEQSSPEKSAQIVSGAYTNELILAGSGEMNTLPFASPTALTLSTQDPRKISFASAPNPLLGKKHSSPLHSLELAISAGGTLVTVPSVKSSQAGYEWSASAQYRFTHFFTGAGIGQFSVAEKFNVTRDSVIENSYFLPVVNYDSLIVYDTSFQVIDSMIVVVIDSSLQILADTTYEQFFETDTSTVSASYHSSGRYLEIPLIVGYRFSAMGIQWQVSGGASYGWYSGSLRYALNPEGHVITYTPGPVLSLMGRAGAVYAINRKFSLYAYLGMRYVIGLKSDLPSGNYLIYSAGMGLTYRF